MDDQGLLLDDDDCDSGITIPSIKYLDLDEIASQIVWPSEMDRVAMYHVNEQGTSHDPLYLVISKGRINCRTAHMTGETPQDAVECIEPDGRHVTKFISYAKYNLSFVVNHSSYALIQDRVLVDSRWEVFVAKYGRSVFWAFMGMIIGMLFGMTLMGILISQIKTTN